MTSKRKRNTVHVEISSTSNPAPVAAVIPKARALTYGRHSTGRLIQESDIAQVAISHEDLAILQQHLEYSLPTESFLDFEHAVHNDLDTMDLVPVKKAKKIPVSIRPIYCTWPFLLT